MKHKQYIPAAMVGMRAVLGPILIAGEQCRWSGVTLSAIVITALLSDIFDGVLARRWHTDTAALRLCDTLADTAFYLCVAVAIGLGVPSVWQAYHLWVLLLVACEASRCVFDLYKFGKPASYHSYLAKTWGLVLATAVVVTFAIGHVSLWMGAAVLLGLASNLEALAMSLVLPAWQRDVKTIALAWQIRRRWATDHATAGAAFTALLVVGLALCSSNPAPAQALQHITYVGGTSLQGNQLHGRISVHSTDAVEFLGPVRLAIPYDHLVSFESKSLTKVHVGLLTEGLWRLAAPWPETRQLSLVYRDPDEHTQVIVLEMSKSDEAFLVEVLKTRISRTANPQPIPLQRPPIAASDRIAKR